MLYVGTDGGGVKVVSTSTGEVVSTISHSAAKGCISSNAIYSFYMMGKYIGLELFGRIELYSYTWGTFLGV